MIDSGHCDGPETLMRLREIDNFNIPVIVLTVSKGKRDDMPWVEEKLDEGFKKSIMDFSKEKLPQIYRLLDKYKGDIDIIIFKTREEADNYIKEISTKK